MASKGVRFDEAFAKSYAPKRKKKKASPRPRSYRIDNPLAEIDKELTSIMNPTAVADNNSALVAHQWPTRRRQIVNKIAI